MGLVKNLPAMQEMQVLSLGQEDPLEEEMATHSSVLGWRIPWTVELSITVCVGEQDISVPFEGSCPLPGEVKVSAEGWTFSFLSGRHEQGPLADAQIPNPPWPHVSSSCCQDARKHLKGRTDVIG